LGPKRKVVTRLEFDQLYRQLDAWLIIFIEAGLLEDLAVLEGKQPRFVKGHASLRITAERSIRRIQKEINEVVLDAFELLSLKEGSDSLEIEQRYAFLSGQSALERARYSVIVEMILSSDRREELENMILLMQATNRENYHRDLEERLTLAYNHLTGQ